MNRVKFMKGALASGAAFFAAPFFVAAPSKHVESTYDKLREKIGFNHVPNNEIKTMNTVLHKANTRGSADHGWLKVNHTFSFANYHNPERMHFGVLRVFNDDSIAGGKGFNTHPHDNMEIITIPLQGDLQHKDNMGNGTVIKSGDVQVMSAGTGITHSEFNASQELDVKVLQIWLFPNKKNVTPRYDQLAIRDLQVQNEFCQILSPNDHDQGVWIHQNSWFSMGEFNDKKTSEYKLKAINNGVYAFIIEGSAVIEGQMLEKRDGFGMWDMTSISISAEKNSRILLMEVPMQI
tara:strand:- start:12817 stop:13692 length:876 start_codon:yes stop_codon:yes gene_type:complete